MTPYRPDANLGMAYNRCMELLPNGAWAIFRDHDCMETTGQWFNQFAEAIAFKPEAGAIVAMTNRIAAPWQRVGDKDGNDIAAHRKFGAERAKIRTLVDITDTRGWGGVMFAISKTAWQECGGFPDGLGCVDHGVHYRLRAAGRKVWMHMGIFVYHWRHQGSADPTAIHPKAANCPCRSMPEGAPGEIVRLP